jgi:hypothetical protein
MNNICNKLKISNIKKLKLTTRDIDILNSIEYKKQELLKIYIKRYSELNIDYNVLKENWDLIEKLPRYDSSSLKSFQIRFGYSKGNQLFLEKNEKSKFNIEKFLEIHGEEKLKKLLKRKSPTLEAKIEVYGEELGKVKYNEYLIKRANTYKSNKQQGKQYPKMNREYYYKLHGHELGEKIFNNKLDKQRYKVSKQWYIDTYGPILGPELCRKCKTHNSYEIFVKKHGLEKGSQKWNEYLQKQTKKSISRNFYSKWSIDLFNNIKETITDLYYFGENELAFSCEYYTPLHQKIIRPDLFYKGKIIECNGDLFHANPKLFNEDDTPHPYNKNITSKEIWEIDNKKNELYISKGYKVFIVWQHEYQSNQTEIIKKCIEFLKS